MSTLEERRAYCRGYNAARANRWPSGIPPMPDEFVLRLAAAAKYARDMLDNELAMMSPGDEPWTSRFGPAIDQVDESLQGIEDWMRSHLLIGKREGE